MSAGPAAVWSAPAVVRLGLGLAFLGYEWPELCTLGPGPAIHSSSACRCEGSVVGPVISVVPLRAETVIASNAEA